MTTAPREYFAVIHAGHHGGSFARGPDLEDVCVRAATIFRNDFHTRFDLRGQEVTMAVFDITGNEEVEVDIVGRIFGDNDETHPITALPNRTVTYSETSRRGTRKPNGQVITVH